MKQILVNVKNTGTTLVKINSKGKEKAQLRSKSEFVT